MAQIDRSAVRTPMNFVAVLAILVVLRIGIQAASATVHEDARPTAWKTASEADKDLLPGAEDIKEVPTLITPHKRRLSEKPKQVFANIPLSAKDKQDIENGKLVLYEFVSDWSDPCRSMEQNALSNSNISSIIENKFVPVRITDRMREDGKNPKWVANLQKRYHIFALPTLVVVDSLGEQRAALIGNCSSLTVERFLNRVKQ